MPAPLEIRNFLPRFTIEMARAGVNPTRMPTGPGPDGQPTSDLFGLPVLQYRYREKVMLDGVPTFQWSDWIAIDWVREDQIES